MKVKIGRKPGKEGKSIYKTVREELDISREKASELLGVIPPERIEKIESSPPG